MSGRLTDEQVRQLRDWGVAAPSTALAPFRGRVLSLAVEVQAWRALVNGGPCETCDGMGYTVEPDRRTGEPMQVQCMCDMGTRPGLIARLEAALDQLTAEDEYRVGDGEDSMGWLIPVPGRGIVAPPSSPGGARHSRPGAQAGEADPSMLAILAELREMTS